MKRIYFRTQTGSMPIDEWSDGYAGGVADDAWGVPETPRIGEIVAITDNEENAYRVLAVTREPDPMTKCWDINVHVEALGWKL
jgi:hypothetical protein